MTAGGLKSKPPKLMRRARALGGSARKYPCVSRPLWSGFVTSAKMSSQELFCRRKELQAVFWLGKAMALIREKPILIGNALALHRRHDLLRFRLLHTRVVRALPNQKWYMVTALGSL